MTEASSEALEKPRRGFAALAKTAVTWLLVGVAGFMLNEGLAWARDAAMDKPDYLQDLAKKQEQEFKDINDQLKQIGASIESGDRQAFAQVKDSIEGIERTNSSLIQQLVLAKQENETLRRIAQEKAGVSGGYDFILAENAGVRIDRDTVLGVDYVSERGARVNLTHAGADRPSSRFLGPGESVPFRSETGADCKVSMVSFNDAKTGTASFVVGCNAAT